MAQTLAERRSASNSYVNVKVSAQGVPQPDVNITPDTTQEDVDRMTDLAIYSVARIMAATAPEPKPEKKTTVVHVRPKAATK